MRFKTGLFALIVACNVASAAETVTPAAGLKRLIDGNERYTKDQFISPDRTQERREALVNKQKPYAVIVGCSDSRVSPEIIFDQGIGDLFVVRVAGNVVGAVELDSIDYSLLYLGSTIIVVLGHENCGAVKAVVDGTTKDIETVAKMIEPAIAPVRNDPLEVAIKANVKAVTTQLKNSAVISHLMKEGKVNVVSGYYDLTTGKVNFLTDEPAIVQ